MAFHLQSRTRLIRVIFCFTADDTHTNKNYEWIDNAIVFDVINVDKPLFIGTNNLGTQLKVVRG